MDTPPWAVFYPALSGRELPRWRPDTSLDLYGHRPAKLVGVKNSREIQEILEAYDLTGSYRAAAELAGVDHHTVKRYVQLREAGERQHRARPIDEFMDKIEELVAVSKGRIRADIVHPRITAMGFTGGDRTTRRAVAEVKSRMRSGHHRASPWRRPCATPARPSRPTPFTAPQGGRSRHSVQRDRIRGRTLPEAKSQIQVL